MLAAEIDKEKNRSFISRCPGVDAERIERLCDKLTENKGWKMFIPHEEEKAPSNVQSV